MAEPENSRYSSLVLSTTGCLSFFIIGFQFTVMGPLVPVLQEVYNNTYTARYGVSMSKDVWNALLTLTISCVLVGGFIGGCSNKFLLGIMSRKRLIQLSNVLYLIGIAVVCLIGGLTSSYEAIIVGRLVVGIPLGILYTLIPMFNAEMSARRKHHVWQSVTAMSLVMGSLVGPALSHPKILGTPQLWAVSVSFGIIPSLVYLAASIRFPLSPYHLVREGRLNEALEALRKLRNGNENDIKNELASIEKEINETANVLSLKEVMAKTQYRRVFFSVFALFVGFVLTGAGHFYFYTDFVFLEAGVDKEVVTFATLGVFALQCLVCLPAFKVISKVGGLKALIGSTMVVLFSLVLFTISRVTSRLAPTVMPIFAIVAAAMLICSFGAFTGPAMFVVLSDITTEPIRPIAFLFGSVGLWFFTTMVGILAPYLEDGLGAYSVTIWLVCTILFLVFQIKCLPETKGKTTEEIQGFFK